MGSTLYNTVLYLAAADYEAGGPIREFFDSEPWRMKASRAGMRLMAAFHYCALDGSAPAIARHFPSCGGDANGINAWHACRAFLASNQERIAALFDHIPQTNEIGRAALLLGGALCLAAGWREPLEIFEVGAGAGLNLLMDRYSYHGRGWTWGNSASLVSIPVPERGGKPAALDAPIRITARRGCDLNPLAPSHREDRLTLESFVCADQTERLARLRSALSVAADAGVVAEKGDMFEWLPRVVFPEESTMRVIMHSVVTEHLSVYQRTRLHTLIRIIGASATVHAPIAWLRMEPADGVYETRVTVWPTQREIVIATSDGHGNDICWHN
jgi:hypothetical protein